MTVEIGYALCSAVFASVPFLARVVSVLVRLQNSAQPSQPGRTSPDS
ncbi:DUF6332 family protein [Streptomyces sp900105755]